MPPLASSTARKLPPAKSAAKVLPTQDEPQNPDNAKPTEKTKSTKTAKPTDDVEPTNEPPEDKSAPESIPDPISIDKELDREIEDERQRNPSITKKRVRNLQEEPDLVPSTPESESTNQREQDSTLSEISKLKPAPVKISDHSSKDTPAPAKLTPAQRQLQQRIEICLAYYLFRPESIVKRSPWAVMHGMLPFGLEAEVVTPKGNANAIAWMCFNGKCRTQKLFLPNKEHGFSMAVGPGVQGHEGQFLAMLAQSNVPSTYPIQFGDKRGNVQDIIQYEMASCKVKTELTFKLIGLSHYLPSDQSWTTPDGTEWNIAKLVEEELAQPVNGAACGGTHRLMGLTYCVQRRDEQNLPIEGQFARAALFTSEFRDFAWTLQNPDGSFSTKWFEGRAYEADVEKKVQTTGHILEWILYATPQDELNDPRIAKSLHFLVSQLYDQRDHDWPIGPRGHALRALNLYDTRFFGATSGQQRQHLAALRRAPSRR